MPAAQPVSSLFDSIRWNSDGLVPAIAQDAENGEVLMMAWMSSEALRLTISTGQTHFHSRSRSETWHKGGTSGHIQTVEEIRIDCDGDTLLLRVRQAGGACHEGYRTCFFRRADAGQLLQTVEPRVFDPATVYRERSGQA